MTTATLSEIGTAATTTRRVYRSPSSLAGMGYYLEIGTTVYITGHAGGVPRVSTIANKSDRFSEDIFSLPYSSLQLQISIKGCISPENQDMIDSMNESWDSSQALRDIDDKMDAEESIMERHRRIAHLSR